MKITCNKDGIVKWEEQGEIPDIPMDIEITKLVPKVRKLKEHAEKHYVIKEISYREEKDQLWVDILLMDITPINYIKINLLPKECQMKTRYVVVNLKEKEEFEKKWEMSYGYNNSPYIGFNQREAINWISQNLGPNERKDYVVERHNAGKIDIVWKILDGHKLAGEEEQEEHDFDEEF